MMTVRTYLAQSTIHGIGLYAAEPIAKGEVVWVMTDLDMKLSEEQVAALPAPAREQILHHTYRDLKTGELVLCGDNARFMNHCETPNTGQISPVAEVALRDIAAGEEITCDYRTFDADFRRVLDFEPVGMYAAPMNGHNGTNGHAMPATTA